MSGPLATIPDLEARLGRTLAGTDLTRAGALLDDASAKVRSYTGQDFSHATTTKRLTPRGGLVRLPQRPVLAVTGVADTDGNPLSFTWLGGDRLQISLTVDQWQRNGVYAGAVDVTYEHGYTSIPPTIVAVVCQIAGRALGRAPDEAGVTGESIGEYSYTVGAASAAGALGVLADEKAVLDPYRRVGVTARVG